MDLVLPSEKYKESYLEAEKEFQEAGENLEKELHSAKDFSEFVQKLEDKKDASKVREGRVQETIYWLVDNEEFIGKVNVRYELNDRLKKSGGHLGYKIRPSKRGVGYGSKILELALPKAKELGIDSALLTCNESNEASRKIIEKHGGEFDKKVPDGEKTKLHYWIKLK